MDMTGFFVAILFGVLIFFLVQWILLIKLYWMAYRALKNNDHKKMAERFTIFSSDKELIEVDRLLCACGVFNVRQTIRKRKRNLKISTVAFSSLLVAMFLSIVIKYYS